MEAFSEFVGSWTDTNGMKPVFLGFADLLTEDPDTVLDFVARPGVSYSLRARRKDQGERPLFVMVDVVDDEPDSRWLSVCFFGDTISDPDQAGELIPGGLLGEDGYCFDLDEPESDRADYIMARVKEARDAA